MNIDGWDKGYCTSADPNQNRRTELYDDCINMPQTCTKEECLSLCLDVEGRKACEYHENSHNCVALLDHVTINTTLGDGFGFCNSACKGIMIVITLNVLTVKSNLESR